MEEAENLLDLLIYPMMLDRVKNWPKMAHHALIRLQAESAAAGGIPVLETAINSLSKQGQMPDEASTGPTIPTVYRFSNRRFSVFGTIAQFSSVIDETIEDLRFERFFPNDLESNNLLVSMKSRPRPAIGHYPPSRLCGPSDRTFAALAKTKLQRTGDLRDFPELRFSSFAYAAFRRARLTKIEPTQRSSPKRPFKRTKTAGNQTVLSLRFA